MHDVQSDSVGLLKQVMVMLLLQSAIHHRSRMRLYYWLRPRTHRAVKTAEEAGCELRPSPLVEGAVLAPGRSSKGGGALEFELPKTAETAAQTTENKKRETGLFENVRRAQPHTTENKKRETGLKKRETGSTTSAPETFVQWYSGDPKYARARRSSPLRAPRRSNRTAAGVCAPCPLRRSLLAFGSTPASRATRTPGTGTHGRVVATSSQLRATRSAV
jgi:hypothetical protein